jgi:hypothetical protein
MARETRPSAGGRPAAVGEAFCPHCFLPLESGGPDPWPPSPTRCPHCRLIVGPGRAKSSPAGKPGARGSAAGIFAHRARDREEPGRASPAAVRDAIRAVARQVGSRPERLLMVDYQQHARDDDNLPALSEVFAAFGSWKRARREAGV